MLASMADIKSVEQRSANMRRIRRRNGKAELALRRAVFNLGGRYRVDDGSVLGRPDLCFRHAKVAVFVDSRFWHGQLAPSRIARMQRYWREKLTRNRLRDIAVNRSLARRGWLVIRVPERTALKHPGELANFVVESVRTPRLAGSILRLDKLEKIA